MLPSRLSSNHKKNQQSHCHALKIGTVRIFYVRTRELVKTCQSRRRNSQANPSESTKSLTVLRAKIVDHLDRPCPFINDFWQQNLSSTKKQSSYGWSLHPSLSKPVLVSATIFVPHTDDLHDCDFDSCRLQDRSGSREIWKCPTLTRTEGSAFRSRVDHRILPSPASRWVSSKVCFSSF